MSRAGAPSRFPAGILPFGVRPITADDAVTICHWRYPGQYAFYDYDPQDWRSMLAPEANYFAVTDAGGAVAGFLTFGANARVPGAQDAGLYREDALDLGLGLRPDLTGRGFGQAFLATALAWATELVRPAMVRLVVAAFNTRAIRAYERAGFRRGPTFTSLVHGRDVVFLLMSRPGTGDVLDREWVPRG
ncbi:MAG: GNAT family N-acetyltransferase [Chloroflexia bacterium]|nr:GNAT family N-acetyltransferase [Chloroflexia bacterium]MDQ3512869.1 GNAT family N-acetyltransferase [Chloroflexota bacterium]